MPDYTEIEIAVEHSDVAASVQQDAVSVNRTDTAVTVVKDAEQINSEIAGTAVSAEVARIIQPIIMGGVQTAVVDFALAAWVQSGERWYLDIEHGLEAQEAALIQLVDDENNKILAVQSEENYTPNKLRLWVADESMRFSGKAIVIKGL